MEGEEEIQEEVSDIQEISEGIERLDVQEEPSPPPLWPSDLIYITDLVWNEDIPDDFKEKFGDSTEITPLVEVLAEEEYRVIVKNGLVDGVWLGEYTGAVKNIKNIEDDTFAVLLYTNRDTNSTFVVDASEFGNEIRLIRKTNQPNSNCKLFRMWVNGTPRVFLQIIKDVQAGEELFLESEEILPIPHRKSISEEEKLSKYSNYTYINSLYYDLLTENEKILVTKKKTLIETVILRTIDNVNHPCYQQLGLFAQIDIKNGTYIGEYTGRVLTHVEEPFSRYLVDYSNPHSEGCEKVWVDALLEGNEIRYINDFKNTGHNMNVTFRKMFLDGIMKVFVQAIADIKANDEILVDYGDGYWDNMPGYGKSEEVAEEIEQQEDAVVEEILEEEIDQVIEEVTNEGKEEA